MTRCGTPKPNYRPKDHAERDTVMVCPPGSGRSREAPTQLGNLVPEERGALELELASSIFHVGFELFDQPVRLVGREGSLGGVRRLRLGNGPDSFVDVLNCLPDADRRDPVLLVVLELNLWPSVGFVRWG